MVIRASMVLYTILVHIPKGHHQIHHYSGACIYVYIIKIARTKCVWSIMASMEARGEDIGHIL